MRSKASNRNMCWDEAWEANYAFVLLRELLEENNDIF